jgi:hypothetical protein
LSSKQYELTVQAETLTVSGAKLPAVEATEERAKLEERVGQLRELIETLDLLYEAWRGAARRVGRRKRSVCGTGCGVRERGGWPVERRGIKALVCFSAGLRQQAMTGGT